ncbi:MAG: L-threonylcarbamoyladenylate synthase [Pyrinomonadaceae bacterium]
MIIPQTVESHSQIASVIANGGIITFRTDTFYGLGADPFNRAAVQRIKQLKGGEDRKPILVVVSDREQVGRFISEPSPAFDLLARTFWPGPLTLIGRAAPEVPAEITAGTETIGVRLPGDDTVRVLVRVCGGALTATSANPPHQNPAKTAQEVSSYFSEAIDLIVDGGAATTNQPSTVVDVCGVEPRLIREGVISWLQIQTAIDQIEIP